MKFESNDKSLPSKITILSELNLLSKNCVTIVMILFKNRKTISDTLNLRSKKLYKLLLKNNKLKNVEKIFLLL